jgi:hypothetical protein
MNAIRSHSLLETVPPLIWRKMRAFNRVFDRPLRFFLWENALRPFFGDTAAVLDRRGIVLGSEAELHARQAYVLGLIRDVLGLAATPGWETGSPEFARAIMESFYPGESHRVAWVMVETCREPIGHRHARVRDEVLPGDGPRFLTPAPALQFSGMTVPLMSGLHVPSRTVFFSLPDGRKKDDATLTRTQVMRELWTQSRPQAFRAVITNWCIAHRGHDEGDLAKGFVPAGLQCRRPDGINAARLIMWYRLDMQTPLGNLQSYAVDIDPLTGELLSLRHQQADLLTATEIDPWLNDWLVYALRHFRDRTP